MKDFPSYVSLGIALAVLGACGSAGAGIPSAEAVEGARTAAARYHDVSLALADGYVRDPLNTCETPAHRGQPAELGDMGIHYLHPALLGVGPDQTRFDASGVNVDFERPGILIYEPHPDDELVLVGVANIVSAAAWESEGNRRPPSFGGAEFTYMADDPAQLVAAHYDMHLWLFRDNPGGIAAQYNPAVSCRHHVNEMPMMHPMGDAVENDEHEEHTP